MFDQRFATDAKNVSLSQTGTYTLLIEDDIFDYANSSGSINYRFRVQPIAETQELTLGETVPNKLSTDSYSFTLDENSKLYFDSLTNNSSFNWTLTKTDGTKVVDRRRFDQSDGLSINDPVLNLSAGEYSLKIDGSDVITDYSFKLSNLNQAGSLSLGTQIQDSFEQVKGTEFYQFDATAGERFFFDFQQMTNSAYGSGNTQWRLIDPDGNKVFNTRFSQDVKDLSLSQTGTYTLLVESYIYDYISNNATSIDYRFQVDPISADLTVTNPTAPNAVTWGQPFNLAWQVDNQGSLTSTGWRDRIYLSKDATLDDDDLAIASFNDSNAIPLAKNENASKSKEITIDTLEIDKSTSWYILVEAQTNQRDADKSNDVAAKAIELLPPNHADLVVDSVTAPNAANSGSEIEVNWRVSNQGDIPTNTNTWRDRIILSNDTVLDNSDRQIGLISHTGNG